MRAFLIPARGGSKTILDKNICDLGGVPLIEWTIAAARAASRDKYPVYVSSDDDKILDISESAGATAHKRPPHLSTDQASMRDVVRDFFRSHGELLEVVLLYPTSPFRTAATITQAMAFFDEPELEGKKRHTSLMSVHQSKSRPFGGVQIINGKLLYGEDAEAYYRKQDTPALYHANGAIFIISRFEIDNLNNQLFNKDTLPFIMHGHEAIDIDTPQDLEIARGLVATKAITTMAHLTRQGVNA